MKSRSRLSRRVESQSKRNLFLSLFGMVAIIGILLVFGVPLIANTTMLLGKKDAEEQKEKKDIYVAAPVLDSQPNATNSAQITVSGSAFAKQKISLYINDELVDKTDVDDKNRFVFKNVGLKAGENTIKAKAIKDNSQSEFSYELLIAHLNKAPSLTIDSPSNDQKYQKDDNTAKVSGKTDAGVKITVNDFWAIVDVNGNFSYTLPLKDGDNEIKVVAVDDASNRKEEIRKVNYSR